MIADMGKTAVIIDNGKFPTKEYPRYLLSKADYIVCCDGALAKFFRHMEQVFGEERMPDVVIGDMDSIGRSVKRRSPVNSSMRRSRRTTTRQRP